MTARLNSIKLVKELFKHARRDDCYNCKELLRSMGLNPMKDFESNFNAERWQENRLEPGEIQKQKLAAANPYICETPGCVATKRLSCIGCSYHRRKPK